jgi:hypothetical protein
MGNVVWKYREHPADSLVLGDEKLGVVCQYYHRLAAFLMLKEAAAVVEH